MLLRTCLALCLGASLGASEAIDHLLAGWDAEVLKARQTMDAAVAKAADKAGRSLEATATAAVKKGDVAAATATWKSLLAINPDHAKAREFFAAAGTLDAVLREVTRPTDLLGNQIATADLSTMPADAKAMEIGAPPGREAVLGALKTGTTVMVQYVQGDWEPRVQFGNQSPDAPDAPDAYRLALVDRSTGRVVATVPAGTAAKPFAITIMSGVADGVLSMAPPVNPRSRGAVTYQVAVIP